MEKGVVVDDHAHAEARAEARWRSSLTGQSRLPSSQLKGRAAMRAVVMRNGVLVLDEVRIGAERWRGGREDPCLRHLRIRSACAQAHTRNGRGVRRQRHLLRSRRGRGHGPRGRTELMESTDALVAGTRVCSVPITQHEGAVRTVGCITGARRLRRVPAAVGTDAAARPERSRDRSCRAHGGHGGRRARGRDGAPGPEDGRS